MGSLRCNPPFALFVLYGAAFVAAFNENMVNVALMDIMAEFDVGSVTAQWLVTGYMVVTCLMVALSAFLAHRFSLRPLFAVAALLLAGGCLAASLAPSFPVLLAFRLVQAGGTGLFIPLMMSSVLRFAPPKRLGLYLSIGGCCITLGPAFGPVASGLMVTLGGWRWAFVPTLAAMLVLLAVGLVVMKREPAKDDRPTLDAPSLVLALAGLSVLSYGLTLVASATTKAVALAAAGLVLLAVFGMRQMRIACPLLNVEPLRRPKFGLACALAFVAMMTTFSMSVLMPLYFQGALGLGALESGLLILVPIACNALTALVGGRVMDHAGEWPLLPCGFALIVAGQIMVCALAAGSALWPVVIAAAVVYAGVGLVLSPSQTAGLGCLNDEESPYGVSIMNIFIQMAACLGPSLYVGILSTVADGTAQQGIALAVSQALGFSGAVAVAAAVGLAGFAIALPFSLAARKARAGAHR